MNHCAQFRTVLILLLLCPGGATPPAAGRSESERRTAMVRELRTLAEHRCHHQPAADVPPLESALDDLSPMDEFDDALRKDLMREKKHDKERRGPKIWDQWGKWSPCSVTCGIGKIVRWRHCVAGGCAPGEKEAQIKSCTLPAC